MQSMITLCASSHSIAIDNDGAVWGTGYSYNGTMGVYGDNKFLRFTFTKLVAPSRVVSVSCCAEYSLFVDEENDVWHCGYSPIELGWTRRLNFEKVPHKLNLPKIQLAVGGENHLLFLDLDGNVWGLGKNERSQLGVDAIEITEPVKLDLPPIKSISCGASFSAFLDVHGTVWNCGSYNSKRKVEAPEPLTDLPSIVRICCGEDYLLMIDFEASVWGMGQNEYGQLGLGHCEPTQAIELNLPEPILHIACGKYHTIFLAHSGTVYACGYNDCGQLGSGNHYSHLVPTKINNLPNIIGVACGSRHSLFVDEEKRIWACGDNRYHQCGITNFVRKLFFQDTGLIIAPRTVPMKFNLKVEFQEECRTDNTKSARKI